MLGKNVKEKSWEQIKGKSNVMNKKIKKRKKGRKTRKKRKEMRLEIRKREKINE